jgi:1-phosphofructokinase family hexose kinase
MIYCTLLNPALDLIYSTDKFAVGGTLRDVPLQVTPAGKGVNVATIVRTLGEEAAVIGIMPEESENRFAAWLEAKSVRHFFFSAPGDVRMNVTLLDSENAPSSHINSKGPPVSRKAGEGFLKFALGHLSRGDQWCFSGSVPAGLSDDLYARLILMCKGAGIDTFLDTRGKALSLGLGAGPLVLKPNSTELEEIFGEQIQGVRHIALKGKKLLDRGVSHVFITLGSDGMIALHDNDCLLCVPPQVKSVDTVGCGDAFLAGVLVAWKRRFSFSETCRLATACGTAKAMHEGPHSVTRDEVWQLMEDVKITAV